MKSSVIFHNFYLLLLHHHSNGKKILFCLCICVYLCNIRMTAHLLLLSMGLVILVRNKYLSIIIFGLLTEVCVRVCAFGICGNVQATDRQRENCEKNGFRFGVCVALLPLNKTNEHCAQYTQIYSNISLQLARIIMATVSMPKLYALLRIAYYMIADECTQNIRRARPLPSYAQCPWLRVYGSEQIEI